MPAENRARVLRAASRSFLRHGYRASVDEIARRAGVAKQTLYHHFPSKEDLFKEVSCDLAKSILVELDTDPRGTRAGLMRFAAAYRNRVLGALALAMYAGSAGEMLQRLAASLRQAMQAGVLRRDDPEFAAELFLSMLAGHERERRIYGIGNGAESEPRRVGRIVDCFLRAFAP